MRRLILTLLFVLLLPVAVTLGVLSALAAQSPVAPTIVAPVAADPLQAAEVAFGNEDTLLAIGYLGQIGPGDPDYARAQRTIGYRGYVCRLGRPAEGLRFVLRALARDPLSQNAWEDVARTYQALIFER